MWHNSTERHRQKDISSSDYAHRTVLRLAMSNFARSRPFPILRHTKKSRALNKQCTILAPEHSHRCSLLPSRVLLHPEPALLHSLKSDLASRTISRSYIRRNNIPCHNRTQTLILHRKMREAVSLWHLATLSVEQTSTAPLFMPGFSASLKQII
jgi:hypothetical protein